MKLIGAGLPRTATLTQKLALETLGLPTYHMNNVLMDLDLAAVWQQILDGETPVQDAFEGFEATVDWPGSYYYQELMEAYPDAKVLLSVRSGESWARSMHTTIWGLFYDDILMRHLSDGRAAIDEGWRNYIEMMKEMWTRAGLLNGADTTLEFMAQAFDRYNDEVKATVPADRLLVWTPADGWEPICELLGLPVPREPLPHVNESSMFSERICGAAMNVIGEALAAETVAA
jgi:hypothetical protein